MKKFALGLVLVLSLFMLSGCFKKTAITTGTFNEIVGKSGYTSVDVTNQFASEQQVKEATVALHSDGYQIEFYVLDTESDAVNMFNKNKDNFENGITGTSSKSETNMGNYNTYTLNNNGKYSHLCRVDNTLLYVNVNEQYKDAVKKVIDELGY